MERINRSDYIALITSLLGKMYEGGWLRDDVGWLMYDGGGLMYDGGCKMDEGGGVRNTGSSDYLNGLPVEHGWDLQHRSV